MSSTNGIESFGKWFGANLLFAELLEADDRTPCRTFSVPDSILKIFNMEEGGNKFGFLAPKIEFWVALVVVIFVGALLSSCLSYITYHFILLPQKQQNQNDKKQIEFNVMSLPFLVGFGIIMPFCVFSPYYELRFFGIKNKIMKFLITMSQLTIFFRCSEAIFGFAPPNVDNSLKSYIKYTAFPVEAKFDANGARNGAIKSTWGSVIRNAAKFVKHVFILGMYSSILSAYDYQPYPLNEGPNLRDINVLTGFSFPQMINNMSVAILFQLYLTTFGYGIFCITSLCGIRQYPMMLNPLFESSSPSDFWGRKWNVVVHGMLKRGVYKPVRTKFSRLAASTAAFVASGLFHEWQLTVIFHPDGDDEGLCSPPKCYLPGYGRMSLFMLWNAILIGFEHAFGGAAVFMLVKENLPPTLVSLLVTSTALPVAHWFTNDYVRSDFFKDAQLGFPLIVRVFDEKV